MPKLSNFVSKVQIWFFAKIDQNFNFDGIFGLYLKDVIIAQTIQSSKDKSVWRPYNQVVNLKINKMSTQLKFK